MLKRVALDLHVVKSINCEYISMTPFNMNDASRDYVSLVHTVSDHAGFIYIYKVVSQRK